MDLSVDLPKNYRSLKYLLPHSQEASVQFVELVSIGKEEAKQISNRAILRPCMLEKLCTIHLGFEGERNVRAAT